VAAFAGARRAALRNQLEQLAGPRDTDADIGAAERPLAWIVWFVAPLGYLAGFENRMLVMTQWGFSVITRARGAHLITDGAT
jgi:hypothetical protein